MANPEDVERRLVDGVAQAKVALGVVEQTVDDVGGGRGRDVLGLRAGQVHGRVALLVGQVGARATLEQQQYEALVLLRDGDVQRRDVHAAVELVGVGALLDEALDDGVLALDHRVVQHVELIAADALGLVLEEEVKELVVGLGDGQREHVVRVGVEVDVGAGAAHQPLGDVRLVQIGGHVEERVARAVLDVGHGRRGHQALHTLQVARLDGVQDLVLGRAAHHRAT